MAYWPEKILLENQEKHRTVLAAEKRKMKEKHDAI